MWIVEQIPGETMKKDVTSYLYEDVMIVNGSDRQGYWGSYNIPYFEEIYDKSGYNTPPHIPDNDYYNCSRHNIFKRDAVETEWVVLYVASYPDIGRV